MSASSVLLNTWIKTGKVKMLEKGYRTKCAIWQGAINTPGYPQGRWDGEVCEMHRVMLEQKTGDKLDKSDICMHACNNKKCVNPGHLSKGTVSENTQDAHDDGLID